MTSTGARLPGEADELFALPREAFTSARDELARRLRAEGRRGEAESVKALRSPTLPAWVVNQLARTEAQQIERLVEAGAAYRRSQTQAALADERRALNALVAAARGVLREAGRQPSQSVLERVRATLQAGAAADEAAAALRQGRLSRELEPSALETLLAAGAAARGRTPKRPPKRRPDRRALQAAARRAQTEEREARKAVERAEAELERARRSLAEAQARVAQAERRLD